MPSMASVRGNDPVAVAAQHMYAAEVALHTARQSGVDSWVSAAYDRLHAAIAEHSVAARSSAQLAARSAARAATNYASLLLSA
jgi:hypothetical protein